MLFNFFRRKEQFIGNKEKIVPMKWLNKLRVNYLKNYMLRNILIF